MYPFFSIIIGTQRSVFGARFLDYHQSRVSLRPSVTFDFVSQGTLAARKEFCSLRLFEDAMLEKLKT
jgi:hypothetical protein